MAINKNRNKKKLLSLPLIFFCELLKIFNFSIGKKKKYESSPLTILNCNAMASEFKPDHFWNINSITVFRTYLDANNPLLTENKAHMKYEFLCQQCTQSKSRVRLHSSGCTKEMEKLGFGRVMKNGKMLDGGCRFSLPLQRNGGTLAWMPGSWDELTCPNTTL